MSILNDLQLVADDVMDKEFELADLRRKRDELIRKAHAEGSSLRELGEIVLVSHQTIKNIIDRDATPAPSA